MNSRNKHLTKASKRHTHFYGRPLERISLPGNG